MVRHNPLVERGPMPAGGRPPVKVAAPPMPRSLLILKPYEEYERLWAAGVIELDHAIQRIKAYLEIGLPGANIDDLEELTERLINLKGRTK